MEIIVERLKEKKNTLKENRKLLETLSKATKKEYQEYAQITRSKSQKLLAHLKPNGQQALAKQMKKEENEYLEASRMEAKQRDVVNELEQEVERLEKQLIELQYLSSDTGRLLDGSISTTIAKSTGPGKVEPFQLPLISNSLTPVESGTQSLSSSLPRTSVSLRMPQRARQDREDMAKLRKTVSLKPTFSPVGHHSGSNVRSGMEANANASNGSIAVSSPPLLSKPQEPSALKILVSHSQRFPAGDGFDKHEKLNQQVFQAQMQAQSHELALVKLEMDKVLPPPPVPKRSTSSSVEPSNTLGPAPLACLPPLEVLPATQNTTALVDANTSLPPVPPHHSECDSHSHMDLHPSSMPPIWSLEEQSSLYLPVSSLPLPPPPSPPQPSIGFSMPTPAIHFPGLNPSQIPDQDTFTSGDGSNMSMPIPSIPGSSPYQAPHRYGYGQRPRYTLSSGVAEHPMMAGFRYDEHDHNHVQNNMLGSGFQSTYSPTTVPRSDLHLSYSHSHSNLHGRSPSLHTPGPQHDT